MRRVQFVNDTLVAAVTELGHLLDQLGEIHDPVILFVRFIGTRSVRMTLKVVLYVAAGPLTRLLTL